VQYFFKGRQVDRIECDVPSSTKQIAAARRPNPPKRHADTWQGKLDNGRVLDGVTDVLITSKI
jgi:hypothetical protein